MRRRTELWWLAGLVALGAGLRFSTLDLQSFWDDEAVTVGRVLAPSLFTTLGHVPSSEASPPLYYVIAWGWTRVFTHSEVGIRSLSALLGTATIPVTWWAGRALVSRRVGLAASAITAVAFTRSVGRIFIEHFESGATLEDFSERVFPHS